MGYSIRELKARLSALGVDFSACVEKAELQQLLAQAEEQSASLDSGTAAANTSGASGAGATEEKEAEDPLANGGFAIHLPAGRCCWVEFADGGDALCHWDDGSHGIVPSTELDALPEAALPGPGLFVASSSEGSSGSFEAARAEAFRTGRLLVASVARGGTGTASRKGGVGAEKAEQILALMLSSEEVAALLEENAIFWRGSAGELRGPQLQQLAPQDPPSVAMVLPLAADAMRVLWTSPVGVCTSKEAIVQAFVESLEALEAHREAATARLASETAQLRQEQDEEFAASLVADQLVAEETSRLATEEVEAGKRPAEELQKQATAQQEEEGRLAKQRRLLADAFLEERSADQEAAPQARLVLRLPGGERVERSFGADEPFARVRRWAECCPLLPEARGRSFEIPARFKLVAPGCPPREFGGKDAVDVDNKTIAELGLVPNAALLLVDDQA